MQFRQCLPVLLLVVSTLIAGVAFSSEMKLAANIGIPAPTAPKQPKVIPPVVIQSQPVTKPSDVTAAPTTAPESSTETKTPPPVAAVPGAAPVVTAPAESAPAATTSTTTPTAATSSAAPTAASTPKPAAQPTVDKAVAAGMAPVGRVVWVKGNFKAIGKSGQERPLDKASILYQKDKLVTADNSQAQIVFTDNTLMTFRPNTQFIIQDYAFDPTKKSGSVGKYFMNLLEGGFRTITGLIAKNDPKSYGVNTPVATIGVRGTDYAVYLNGGELVIGYYKGSPCLTGQGKEVCLDKDRPYAEVSKPGEAPKATTRQPAVLKEKQAIVPASIAPSDDSNSFGGLISGGSGSGGGTGTMGGDAGTSGGDTVSSSSSSSSSTSSGTTISGSDSGSSSNSLNITGTEIQVNTPKPPSGPVSSFCIVQ